ncbi:hypothetical protein ACFXG4_36155 [Nocardia sp. NPDC059246]|uniref:hypothetical protein n=1 Tax=unclassified Nocardia TaxID=2637762 RepID=UPI0036C516D5
MKSVVTQACLRSGGALVAALMAAGLLAGCGGGDSGGTSPANPDQAQMESNLRAVMSAKSPSDVSDKFCTQFSDLIKSVPAEMMSNAATTRPKGKLTKLQKVEITGDKASAEAVGKSDSGDDYTGPVSFKKESGEWKYCPDLGIPSPTLPTK